MEPDIAIGFAALLAIVFVELALSWTWNRFYFTFGLPVFMRRIERPDGLQNVSLETLQKSAATVAATPLLFRQFAPETIVFREKGFGGAIHYVPIMRGLIRHNPGEPSVTVFGLLNWSFLAFAALMAILLGRKIGDLALMIAFVYGVLYLISAVRYNRVAKALRAGRESAPQTLS